MLAKKLLATSALTAIFLLNTPTAQAVQYSTDTTLSSQVMILGDDLTVDQGIKVDGDTDNSYLFVAAGSYANTITNNGTIEYDKAENAMISLNSVGATGRIENYGTMQMTGSGATLPSNALRTINVAGIFDGHFNNYAGGTVDLNMQGLSASSLSVVYMGGFGTAATFDNAGDITLSADTSNTAAVDMTAAYFVGINGAITNSGNITATGYRVNAGTGVLGVRGLYSGSMDGNNSILNNTGLISATSIENNNSNIHVHGVLLGGVEFSAQFINKGQIEAISIDNATGVEINTVSHDGKVDNQSGATIYAESIGTHDGVRVEAMRLGTTLGTDTKITNSGDIIGRLTANSGTNHAVYGLYAGSGITSGAVFENHGSVAAYGHDDASVIAVGLDTLDADATFANYGILSAYKGNLSAKNYGKAIEILSPNSSATITNHADAELIGAVSVGSTSLDNDGLWDIGLTTDSTARVYTQSASGTLRIALDDNNHYGRVSVQEAIFNGVGHIDVDVRNEGNLAHDMMFTNVIIASSNLFAYDGFNVTDNSFLFRFDALQTANGLDLQAKQDATIVSAVKSNGNQAALGAAQVLDNVLDGTTTASPEMQDVVKAFGKMSSVQDVANAANQTIPTLGGNIAKAKKQIVERVNTIIANRQNGDQSGVSSGDTPAYGSNLAWGQAFGSWADQKDRKGTFGYKADTYGVIFGADHSISDATTAGIGFVYARSDVRNRSGQPHQKVNIDTFQLLAYGSHNLTDAYTLDMQADIGYHRNHTERSITFMPSFIKNKASYNSLSAHIGGAVSRKLAVSPSTTITPAIRADYTWLRDSSYTEKGHAALALNVKSYTTDSLLVGPEARLEHRLNDKSTLNLNLGAGYDVINSNGSLNAAFVGAPGATFATRGVDNGRWQLRAGLGFTSELANDVNLGVRYDVETRRGFTNHSATLGLKTSF